MKLNVPSFRKKYSILCLVLLFFVSIIPCVYAIDAKHNSSNETSVQKNDGVNIKEAKKLYKEFKQLKKEFRKLEVQEKKDLQSFIKENSKIIPKKEQKELKEALKKAICAVRAENKVLGKFNNDMYKLAKATSCKGGKASKKVKVITKRIDNKFAKSYCVVAADNLEAYYNYVDKMDAIKRDHNITTSLRWENETESFTRKYKDELIEAFRKEDVVALDKINEKYAKDQEKVVINK
jgi:hypothetical protein